MATGVACAHAQECAGCPLIELPYEAQLEQKRERVRTAAALYPRLAALSVEPTAPADPIIRYRVRAKLMVAARGDGMTALGLFARARRGEDRHRVVDIPDCQVLAPSLLEVASKLRGLLASPPSDAGRCLVAEGAGGLLSAVDLREVVDERVGMLVTLVLGPGALEGELAAAARAVRELSSSIVGVAANRREAGAVQVLGSSTRELAGSSPVRDRLGAVYELATYGSFTQTHRGQAARIEAWIAARFAGASVAHVLDLYGGSGALSLPLARRGLAVTLVESFRPAVECAERAAREQGLASFAVRAGDAASTLRELVERRAQFDAVIANPPRRGLAPAVRSAIAAIAPRLIAYVSCDPDTLCRDLDHLDRLGFVASSLSPVDMIALTDQVETVVFLERHTPPPLLVAYEDEDMFLLDRAAHDPVLACGGRFGDARMLAGSAGATSGLTLGCKTAAATKAVRASLGGSSRAHLVLCRGNASTERKLSHGTRYRRIRRVGGHSLLRVTVTGDREGSFEADLARTGHPVIGDGRHGDAATNRHFEERYGLDRPFSHCLMWEIAHPHIRAESPLPGELTMVLRRLGVEGLDVTKEVMVGL